MSSNIEGSASAPLLPATRSPDQSQPVAAWKLGERRRLRRQLSQRVRLLIGGVVVICMLTGVLTWATTSIGLAPVISVTLASTDYRSNLNLPPNGLGDRAIGRLAAWVTQRKANSRRHLQLTKAPIELNSAADFGQIDTDPNAAIALIFVSAHGISTANGPALLSADAIEPSDAVLVSDLIERIGTFPTDQKKILMLDCVHFMSLPSMGIVLNDFARQMRELNTTIAAIPNLVVMMSTDTNQQSWINPAAGTTNWATNVINALNGQSKDIDRDGWIDIWDIHHASAGATAGWADHLCGKHQTPVLFPLGQDGEDRGQQIGLFPATTRPIDVPTLSLPARTEHIAKWWRQHSLFESREVHPVALWPVQWRRFEATLRRFEHFELAGCQDAANNCSLQLEKLASTLGQAAVFDSVVCRAGLLAPESVGFSGSATLKGFAGQLATLLSEMPIDNASDHWLDITSRQANAESVAFLRRAIITHQASQISAAFHDQAEVDRERLDRTAALMRSITDPLQPLPQMGIVLQLLARDLPKVPLGAKDATRIARFLELCLQSDRVGSGHDWWAPDVLPWVDGVLQQADKNRRLAGDLLTGEADARQRADLFLEAAETGYSKLDKIASTIASAERMRTVGQHQLGRLRDLAAARIYSSPDEVGQLDTAEIEQLYRLLDETDQLLDHSASGTPPDREESLQRLDQVTQQFDETLATLRDRANQWQQQILTESVEGLPEILAALQVTGGTSNDRIASWNRLSRLTCGTGITATVPANDDATPEPWVMRAAATRGRLALSAWSDDVFNELASTSGESKAQVLHRLELFATEPQWWRSLAEAGYQLGQREQDILTDTMRKRVESLPPLEYQRDDVARQRNRFAGFLARQTKRFHEDGYWSIDQDSIPYFTRATNLLLSDIASLSSSQNTSSELVAGLSESSVELRVPKELIWTTQPSAQVAIYARTPKYGREGFVSIWVRSTGCVQVTQPIANQRVCRPLFADEANSNPVDPAHADALLVMLDRTANVAARPSLLDVYGYFRGRHLHKQIDIRVADRPDVSVLAAPTPRGGRISIRSSDNAIVETSGAMVLVLDCSGSMGADRGKAFGPDTKYAHAVTAVQTLLKSLPSGVKLSVWSFGQATGSNKTVDLAERSIRRIQAPLTWDASDPAMRQNLIDAISYPQLEPWNESPLLATMIAAAEDVRGHKGLRSMVVITDGADNRVATDVATNPLGLSPEALIEKHFGGTGITVNVVAFRVEAGDVDTTRRQLATVENLLPAGRFVEASQTSELVSALAGMLNVQPTVSFHRVDQSRTARTPNTNEESSPVSPSLGAPHWTPRLDAGLYHASTGSTDPESLIHLRDGDQLVLARSTLGRLRLWPTLQHELNWCVQRQCGRWNLALVPVPISSRDSLHRQLVLWASASNGALAVQRPGELWIEAQHEGKSLPIHWQRNRNQPGVTIDMRIACPSTLEPEIKVWVSDRQASPIGTLLRDRDFFHVSDLAPATWHVSDGVVRLQSVTIETHQVADHEGNVKPQPCLVLRGMSPPGTRYRLRTEGITFEGHDDQCFTELGQFTLRQWPVTQEDIEASLQAVHLISIEQFKIDATRFGGTATFAPTPAAPPKAIPQDRTDLANESLLPGMSR